MGPVLGQTAAEATVKTLELLQHAAATGAGAVDPQQLKAELGGAVRSLGEEGKKKGVSTMLPTALGLLQADGRIRRVPLNGRLDQQRYAYTAWGLASAPESPEQARVKLMERYLDSPSSRQKRINALNTAGEKP